MNPFCDGTRIKLGLDVLAKGFNRGELSQAFYGLIAETRQGKLLLECASFEEIDEEYNPGDDRLETEEMVLEAVTVRSFSRTSQTMAALQRVLNKAMTDKGLTVGDAVVGKPKKTGLFASVTVQFPISDGQTLSIIFHSPDNNKMKIMPDDVIIAFRWLLNKRDITVAVSPEGEKDVSLDEVGKRVSQLVEKNSQRFQTQQKALVEGKKALEELKATVGSKQDENAALMNALAEQQKAEKVLADKIEGAKKLLGQTVSYNDQLQAQLDAMKAQQAANAGKAEGEDTSETRLDAIISQKFAGVSDAKLRSAANTKKNNDDELYEIDRRARVQAEQDQAAFEDKKAAFESELTGRGFEALPSGGFNVALATDKEITANMMDFADGFHIATRSLIGKDVQEKSFDSATLAGLDKQIADALKWIDGKLSKMKKPELETIEVVNPDTAGSGTKGIEMDPNANPDPEVINNPVPEVLPAVQALNDILAGKYATSQEISDKLDEAAGELEAAGQMEAQDALLNSVADYLTEILKKEAGGV